MDIARATLRNLTDPAKYAASERYEGFQAGGGGMVSKDQVLFDDASTSMVGDAAKITFDRSDARVEATVEVMDLPRSWKGYQAFRATVVGGDHPVTLELTVVGARSRLTRQQTIEPGQEQEVIVDLVDLPLTAGIRAAYEPPAIRFVGLWAGDEQRTDFERARRGWEDVIAGELRFDVPAPAPGPRSILIRGLELVPRPAAESQPPCVDRFGQRANATWHNKVADESELVAFRNAELEQLEKMPTPTDRDEFGGWTGGPKFEATGFFRTEYQDNVWWMVDPLGNPFYSIGTTGVRTTDNTIPDGREELYEALPPKQGPFADAWLDPQARDLKLRGVSFYRWNILRKYGSKEGWRDRVCARFRKWGFNTIANWSEQIMLDQQMVPHVRTTASRDHRFPMVTKQFTDVFDPRWEQLLDQKFAEEVAPWRDNPWVIGVFVDNESHWGNMRLLSAERDFAIREKWVQFAKTQVMEDLAAFNKAFGKSYTDWDQVRSMGIEDVPAEGPGREMMYEFEALYAATMFAGVRRMLQKHAPNHLYLGCRFVRKMPHPKIVEINGQYADVVSINCYDLYPRPEQFDVWYAVAKRPLIMGEHHFPLLSQRQLPPLYAAFTPEERGPLYKHFVKQWASRPYAVGDHWFQHADQSATGRGSDGENQTVGFVDIADQPHRELVNAAMESTASMYQWHANSGSYELHPDAMAMASRQ